jgi:hypothetical protein
MYTICIHLSLFFYELHTNYVVKILVNGFVVFFFDLTKSTKIISIKSNNLMVLHKHPPPPNLPLYMLLCAIPVVGRHNGHKPLALVLANSEYPLRNFEVIQLPVQFYQK